MKQYLKVNFHNAGGSLNKERLQSYKISKRTLSLMICLRMQSTKIDITFLKKNTLESKKIGDFA